MKEMIGDQTKKNVAGNADAKSVKMAGQICRCAIDLAVSCGSVAVILIGDIPFDASSICSVPVFHVKAGIRDVMDWLSVPKKSSLPIEECAESIEKESGRKTDLVRTISALSFGLDKIREGTVIGIVRSDDDYSIIVHDLRDNDMVRLINDCCSRINPDVFRSILKVAIDLSVKGREGKKVGTAFIVGDEKEVLSRSHQMIINPYKSQEPEEKSVLRPENYESIEGLAQLDGAFIISSEGEIIAAGRYLDVDAHDFRIEKGLGSRHISAASITRDTIAIAFIISESGGTIRVYMDGKEILKINPQTGELVNDMEACSNPENCISYDPGNKNLYSDS
ncbi:diadenylate cyclase [Methanosarcinaceae archaeon]|nr:diadenylate cyclase [Methanosarcinaceae archaeon]